MNTAFSGFSDEITMHSSELLINFEIDIFIFIFQYNFPLSSSQKLSD